MLFHAGQAKIEAGRSDALSKLMAKVEARGQSQTRVERNMSKLRAAVRTKVVAMSIFEEHRRAMKRRKSQLSMLPLSQLERLAIETGIDAKALRAAMSYEHVIAVAKV